MKKRTSGSATLYSLFIAMIVLTLAIGFNWIVREHLKASLSLSQKMSALLSAYSTYNLLLYTLLPAKIYNKEAELYNGEKYLGIKKLPLNGTEILIDNASLEIPTKVSLQDSNGLISLITFKSSVFNNLLKFLGVEEEKRRIIIDSFLDWIDQDDLTRLNGAEKDYYEREGKPKPRNYEIQYKEELSMIRGMDKELYKKVEPFITILPNSGFNPNTAKKEVLQAYLDLEDNATLENLINYLSNETLLSDHQLFQLTGKKLVVDEEEVYYYPSLSFELCIKAGNPESIYTIKTGIDLRVKINTPFEVLYWKEE